MVVVLGAKKIHRLGGEIAMELLIGGGLTAGRKLHGGGEGNFVRVVAGGVERDSVLLEIEHLLCSDMRSWASSVGIRD